MLKGKTLHQLALELDEQQKTKRDFLVDSPAISMQARAQESGPHSYRLTLGKNGNSVNLGINDLGHLQLASKVGIPRKFYDHLRTDYPTLLAQTVTELSVGEPQKMLVRSLGGQARAFLSDRYRTIDNFDLLKAVLPSLTGLEKVGTELIVDSCEVTERRMYIKILFPQVQGEIKVGDPVRAGLVLSNSEVGDGSLRVERLLEILRCLNGMVLPASLRKYHAGRRREFDELDSAVEVYSDRTRQLDDMALFSKVTDVVKAAFNMEEFAKQIEAYKNSTQQEIKKDPVEFIEVTSKRYNLNSEEKNSTLKHFLTYGDMTQYGLMNALTSAAQEEGTQYDRSIELERLGAQVLDLTQDQWHEIAA